MSDHSSAAFVGLILRQMALAGIAPMPGLPPGGPPTVSLDLKRRLLAHAHAAAGPGFILGVGQGIHAIPSDPTLDALRRAATPADLLERWTRLERYHHSHHRVRVRHVDAGAADLVHVSLQAAAPGPLEDLAVLGLLVALLQAIGCRGIEAEIGDGIAAWRDDAATLAQDAVVLPPGASATWRLRWRDQRRDAVAAPAAASGTAMPGSLVDRLYALVDADPVGTWPIAAAAGALATSTRNLQRGLQRLGASYSGILRAARVRRAARAMLETPASLAEIGYAAGFADQAHFTREFRRILGASPAEWRRNAADPSRHARPSRLARA